METRPPFCRGAVRMRAEERRWEEQAQRWHPHLGAQSAASSLARSGEEPYG